VFHAYDVLAATQLAFTIDPCDLVIGNTKVEGADGVELIALLRQCRPNVAVIYLANIGRSTPELEAKLPADVPILREPFTADGIRAAVDALLDGKARQPRGRGYLPPRPFLFGGLGQPPLGGGFFSAFPTCSSHLPGRTSVSGFGPRFRGGFPFDRAPI
jgi:DNA-binding response OmpR family regulator